MARAANPFAKVKVKPPVKQLAGALGDIVKARLAKPKPVSFGMDYAKSARSIPTPIPAKLRAAPQPRGGRRRGRTQFYKPTGKWNNARRGTWRHYMIDAIMAWDNTTKAEREHEINCKDDKWRNQRLDFGWAAKNGFIQFN